MNGSFAARWIGQITARCALSNLFMSEWSAKDAQEGHRPTLAVHLVNEAEFHRRMEGSRRGARRRLQAGMSSNSIRWWNSR